MSTELRNNKSTIVRIIARATEIPWLGDLLLSELFLMAPRRLVASQVEQQVLARGEARWLATPRHRLRTWRWGNGPAILLLHGHGGSAAQLTPFVAPLLAAGYSVIAYDAPGHGQSPGRHTSLLSMAAALREVLAEIGPVHAVIAHSLAGAATCLAAKQGARIGRAVLIAPPSDVGPWYQRFAQACDLAGDQQQRVRALIERRLSTPMRTLRADLLGPHLHASALVIHDQHDKEVAFESGAQVARSIAGARLVSTAGLGHRRILKDAQVIALAVQFVSQSQAPVDSMARVLDEELFEPALRLHRSHAA